MKRSFILLCVLALSLQACNSGNQSTPEQVSPDILNNPASGSGKAAEKALPQFSFEESSFDFGTLHSGDSVSHEFVFTNSGNSDLVITDARGSCGCTVPEYPKSPIAPGDEGVIKVTFHSSGQAGQVMKTVTLLANTIPNTKVLSISAEVLK